MKIVYFGPPLAGKAANLVSLRDAVGPSAKLISEPTETARPISVHFQLPSDGDGPLEVSVHTIVGVVWLQESWGKIFEGVDAVVFVADSQVSQMECNREYVELLRGHLSRAGRIQCPVVLQANKQDLPEIASVKEIEDGLGLWHVSAFGSCAYRGEGVLEAFRAAVESVGAGSSGTRAGVDWDQRALRLAASKAEKHRVAFAARQTVLLRRIVLLACSMVAAAGSILFVDSFTCIPVQVVGKELGECYEVLALSGVSPFHGRTSMERLLGGLLVLVGFGGALMTSWGGARE